MQPPQNKKKRKTDLAERIAHHDKKIKDMDRNNAGMQKKMHLKRILHAWKNAKEFLKSNREMVEYGANPIIDLDGIKTKKIIKDKRIS